MKIVAPRLERYAEAHSALPSPVLRRLIETTRRKTSMSRMLVGPLEGQFLKTLVRLTGARRVLEIGTFTGYSALAMAEGLAPAGRLVTLDVDPGATSYARSAWRRSAHGKKIRLILGPALDSLKKLKGPFDLVFIDADKENYVRYWNACVPKMRKGGLIVADNVLWSGRVLKPRDRSDRAIAAFNRRVRRDRRVEAVMLPVRDGMTLAVRL